MENASGVWLDQERPEYEVEVEVREYRQSWQSRLLDQVGFDVTSIPTVILSHVHCTNLSISSLVYFIELIWFSVDTKKKGKKETETEEISQK